MVEAKCFYKHIKQQKEKKRKSRNKTKTHILKECYPNRAKSREGTTVKRKIVKNKTKYNLISHIVRSLWRNF